MKRDEKLAKAHPGRIVYVWAGAYNNNGPEKIRCIILKELKSKTFGPWTIRRFKVVACDNEKVPNEGAKPFTMSLSGGRNGNTWWTEEI